MPCKAKVKWAEVLVDEVAEGERQREADGVQALGCRQGRDGVEGDDAHWAQVAAREAADAPPTPEQLAEAKLRLKQEGRAASRCGDARKATVRYGDGGWGSADDASCSPGAGTGNRAGGGGEEEEEE